MKDLSNSELRHINGGVKHDEYYKVGVAVGEAIKAVGEVAGLASLF